MKLGIPFAEAIKKNLHKPEKAPHIFRTDFSRIERGDSSYYSSIAIHLRTMRRTSWSPGEGTVDQGLKTVGALTFFDVYDNGDVNIWPETLGVAPQGTHEEIIEALKQIAELQGYKGGANDAVAALNLNEKGMRCLEAFHTYPHYSEAPALLGYGAQEPTMQGDQPAPDAP